MLKIIRINIIATISWPPHLISQPFYRLHHFSQLAWLFFVCVWILISMNLQHVIKNLHAAKYLLILFPFMLKLSLLWLAAILSITIPAESLACDKQNGANQILITLFIVIVDRHSTRKMSNSCTL